MDLGDRMKYGKYLLQLSAVNSQLKNHERSVESSRQAIKVIHSFFGSVHSSLRTNSDILVSKHLENSLGSLTDVGISLIKRKIQV